MRHALAAALALCLATSAGAKFLAVADIRSDASTGATSDPQQQRLLQGAVDVLDRFGVCYTLVTPPQTKTEYCRTGDQVWNPGTPGAYVEHFDGVIHLSWGGARSAQTVGYFPGSSWGYYPDSLTLSLNTNGLPTVPQLFVFGGTNMAVTAGGLAAYKDQSSPPCSTGVTTGNYGTGPYLPSGPAINYLAAVGGNARRWMGSTIQGVSRIPRGGSNVTGMVMNATPPAGGARALVGVTGYATHMLESANNVACRSCDSLFTAPSRDTVVMWGRLNINGPAKNSAGISVPAARNVFVNVMANVTAETRVDSSGTPKVATDFNAELFLMGLAHLDSLTGGAGFCNRQVNVAAIVIRGGFNHTYLRYPGGVATGADTTVFTATLDSVASTGVPVTVAVDVDSISAYPNEVAWWKKLPRARFAGVTANRVGSYETYNGDSVTTGVLGATSNVPADIWGRFRNRTFYGPGTGASQDTSIFTQMQAADSTVAYWFGRSNVSKTVIAPFDDYSPKNMALLPYGPDSLAWVFWKAGKTAVLTDVQRAEADPARLAARNAFVRGWWPYQGWYKGSLENPPLRLAGHTGYSVAGGYYFAMCNNDSNSVDKYYYFHETDGTHTGAPQPLLNLSRFWAGFAHNVWRDKDMFRTDYMSNFNAQILDKQVAIADFLYPQRRANVLLLHASDFSGSTTNYGGSSAMPAGPRRSGWWTVKWLNNQFNAINYFAGRTIVALGYPEDVTP